MAREISLGRRAFLRATAGLAATGAAPALSWADAGAPAFLAAARAPTGSYALFGLGADGAERFRIGLPGRGHAAAAHPTRPLAVAFARRPGTFALVIDCALGLARARLEAPAGRHFYGHGAFSPDGARLFTCENDFDAGEGRIGVWDASAGFARIGEFASGGVGPHELLVDARGGRIIVANGGIQTHPDSGRAKLNLPTMRPNLAYLDLETGEPLSVLDPAEELRRNSLRHLALSPDGLVAIAAQWQGDSADAVPLLATHRFGETALQFRSAPEAEQRRLNGYGGSAAISADGTCIALTAPRGGRAHLFDAGGGFLGALAIDDVCGAAALAGDRILLTDGLGGVTAASPTARTQPLAKHRAAWDNHVVRIVSSFG